MDEPKRGGKQGGDERGRKGGEKVRADYQRHMHCLRARGGRGGGSRECSGYMKVGAAVEKKCRAFLLLCVCSVCLSVAVC